MFRVVCAKSAQLLSSNFAKPTCLLRYTSGGSLYEPVYLEALKPKHPIYPCLNFQVKGYDFTVLESYQKFLHHTAESLDLDVVDGWATPPQHFHITRLKPHSNTVDTEYKLAVYERNIQLVDVAAKFYPIYLRLAQAALPEGVTLTVMEHTEEIENKRYVPDTNLKQLQEELEDLGGARKPKYRKK